MHGASETSDPALARVLDRIHELDLARHLIDLTTFGFSVVHGILNADQIERATAAIVRRVE